jgi:hypothetical protein
MPGPLQQWTERHGDIRSAMTFLIKTALFWLTVREIHA